MSTITTKDRGVAENGIPTLLSFSGLFFLFERLPQGDAAVIAGLAIGSSPSETFFVQAEVFGHS
jgi:hypothetical protein